MLKVQRKPSLFFAGSMNLRTTDPPEVVRGRCVLSLYRHHKNPDWWFILRGSHRPEEIVAWYLAKTLLQNRMREEDHQVGIYLVSGIELAFQGLRKIQRTFVGLSKSENVHPSSHKVLPLPLLVLSERISLSFRPEYYPYRHFSPQKLPPKRIIGVGYKDHGNLSTSPSWRDQVLTDVENPAQEIDGILGNLLSLLHPFPDNPG